MYVKRTLGWRLVLRVAWPYWVFCICWCSAVYAAYTWLGWTFLDIPYEPLSLLGIAVAFFLGFKNNQSYERFWEARKTWGEIVAQSRNLGTRILGLITEEDLHGMSAAQLHTHRQTLLYRHFAWMHTLRLQLRKPAPFSIQESTLTTRVFPHDEGEDDIDEIIRKYIPESEHRQLYKRHNVALHLLHRQTQHLRKLKEQFGGLDGFDQDMLLHVIEQLHLLQTKCEGIKNTPLPRQFSHFGRVFTYLFVLLLPFGLIDIFGEEMLPGKGDDEPDWYLALTVPMGLVLGGIYLMWDLIGSISEDPFEHRFNDVPMTALCREIEIDLRDMLDEELLPKEVEPRQNILY